MNISGFSLERISAAVTCLIVSGFTVYLMWESGNFSDVRIIVTAILCIMFYIVWSFITGNDDSSNTHLKRQIAACLLYCIVLAIYFATPVLFIAIFMVILSASTPFFMGIKRAFMLSPILALPLFIIHHFYWQQSGVVISAILFWSFNIFALVMVNTGIREKEAKLQAQRATRELEATQVLLNEAVKQGERVRIARNIHDLLGHHLTALTINLQVASRKTEGEVKESIEQCHQLSKLLLSDVREAVSDIRDKSKLDLEGSIRSMLDKLPKLTLDMHIDANIQIDNIQVADAIIKAVQETITNTLKHAQGTAITINICYSPTDSSQHKTLQVDISNNGKMPDKIKQGNGLIGISERLNTLAGSARFALKTNKFYTHLIIPVSLND